MQCQVAAVIASRQTDLRLRVRGSATAHHHCTYQMPRQKTRNTGGWSAGSGFASEEVSGSRDSRSVQYSTGKVKTCGFFQAQHLLSQVENVSAIRIQGRGRNVAAVINGVDRS